MNKKSVKVSLLVLTVFCFWGTNTLLTGTALTITQLLFALLAAFITYSIVEEGQSAKDTKLISEQKRVEQMEEAAERRFQRILDELALSQDKSMDLLSQFTEKEQDMHREDLEASGHLGKRVEALQKQLTDAVQKYEKGTEERARRQEEKLGEQTQTISENIQKVLNELVKSQNRNEELFEKFLKTDETMYGEELKAFRDLREQVEILQKQLLNTTQEYAKESEERTKKQRETSEKQTQTVCENIQEILNELTRLQSRNEELFEQALKNEEGMHREDLETFEDLKKQAENLQKQLSDSVQEYTKRAEERAEKQIATSEEQIRMICENIQKVLNELTKSQSKNEELFEQSLKTDEVMHGESLEVFGNLQKQVEILQEQLSYTVQEYEKGAEERAEKQKEILEIQNQIVCENIQKILNELTKSQSKNEELFEQSLKTDEVMHEESLEVFGNLKEQMETLQGQMLDAIQRYAKESEERAGKQEQLLTEQNRAVHENLQKVMNELVLSWRENVDILTKSIKTDQNLQQEHMIALHRLNEIQEEIISNENQIKEKHTLLYEGIDHAVKTISEINGEIKDQIKEQIDAMTAIQNGSLKKLKETVTSCLETINDTLEDGMENIDDTLKEHDTTQSEEYKKHAKELTTCVKEIERIMESRTGEVLKQNRELLEHLSRTQEEWTTLNRTELEFLNKVWDA